MVVVLSLAAGGQAFANPLDEDKLPIPGKQGIAYFYGQWVPTSDNSLIIYASMTIGPGRFVFEKNVPGDDLFKVLAEYDDYVLLFVRLALENRFGYKFAFLSLTHLTLGGSQEYLHKATCGKWYLTGPAAKWNLTEEHFRMSPEELLALWKRHVPCNPLLNGATREKPWGRGGWSNTYFWYAGPGD